MGADPEPNDDVRVHDSERAISQPDSGSVDGFGRMHLLEAEARVVWVISEAAVGFAGPASDMFRKPAVRLAEATSGP